MNEELKKVVINIGYKASSELSDKLWSLLVQTHTIRHLFELAVGRTKDSEIKASSRTMFSLLPDTRRFYENPCNAPYYERESAVLEEGFLSLLVHLRGNEQLMISFEDMFKSERNHMDTHTCEGVSLAESIDRLQKTHEEWKELRRKFVGNYMGPIEDEFGMYFRNEQ